MIAELPPLPLKAEGFLIIHGPPSHTCADRCPQYNHDGCLTCGLRPLKALIGILEQEALELGLITPFQLENKELI
jgi:hypothetical protein